MIGFKLITEQERKVHPNMNKQMSRYYKFKVIISAINLKDDMYHLTFTDEKGEEYSDFHNSTCYNEILDI